MTRAKLPDVPHSEVETREPTDAELLSAVAAGDDDAYGLLWRRHEAAARRLAAQLTRHGSVDDLVSEAFARVLRAVKAGAGPESAFRPYLFSTMRRFTIDTARAYDQRVALTGDDETLDVAHAEPAGEVYAESEEQRAAWLAWQSLPDESRTLLWHLVVEEETPAQVAPLLGVSANGVSSRARRAKERLRQAFLAQHLAQADNAECRGARALLGAYVRDALGARDRAAVEAHLADCKRCAAAVAELRDVNASLRLVIAPLLLGGGAVAAKYLAATHHAAGAGVGALGWFAHVRHLGHGAKIAAGAVGVAACVAAGVAYAATSGAGGPAHTAAAQRHLPTNTPLAAPLPTAVAAPRSSSTPSSPKPAPTPVRTSAPSTAPAVAAPAPEPATLPTTRGSTPRSPSAHPRTSSAPTPPRNTTTTGSAPIGFPHVALVNVQVPTGWTIDDVAAKNQLRVTPGGTQWSGVVSGATVSATATGHGAPGSTMTITVNETTYSYPLN